MLSDNDLLRSMLDDLRARLDRGERHEAALRAILADPREAETIAAEALGAPTWDIVAVPDEEVG